MADELLRVLFTGEQLNGSVVVATGTAKEAQRLHELRPVSAELLAQGLAGGALLASLQKEDTRVNLQLECDGPLRGLLVDASSKGPVRGYVKNPAVDVEGNGELRFRPALGNKGFLSVLRDRGEAEFYRSSIELQEFVLPKDLERYFKTSDQVATRVALGAVREPSGELGAVGGVLLQAMPGAEPGVLAERGSGLQAALDEALRKPGLTAKRLCEAVFGGMEYQVMATTPVRFECTCSRDGVLALLASLGKAELQSLLEEQGEAEVTCHFCSRRHKASRAELEALIAGVS
ncbi:MAG: Hsp33 family molecular chaperone HslO [Myxococcaceae bacterium]